MIPPVENALAAFPPSSKAGNVVLRPLTLGAAIRLGCEGVDCGARIPEGKIFQAAFVLSGESDYRRFLRRAKCGLQELSKALETVLNEAFATWIKPPAPSGASVVKHLTPHGLGWPLECAEFLCSEYGWSWQTALDTPVATCFALMAACRQRNGGKHAGLDYIERRYSKEIKAGRARPVKL